mmetsp:Transcript_41268/g.95551  ORF Transcript_41268/g.95551 Transcript_41268/m.95551 type:complete len:99 (-) Transcript_41268:268-564(-)
MGVSSVTPAGSVHTMVDLSLTALGEATVSMDTGVMSAQTTGVRRQVLVAGEGATVDGEEEWLGSGAQGSRCSGGRGLVRRPHCRSTQLSYDKVSSSLH